MKDLLHILYQRFRQSRWPKILFFLAIIGVVATTILQLITPPETEVPPTTITSTNFVDTTTHFNNIKFSGEGISVETELPILQKEKILISEPEIKQNLLNAFSLKPYEKKENIWVGPQHSMLKPENKSTYVVNLLEIKEPNSNISAEKAQKKASELLSPNV